MIETQKVLDLKVNLMASYVIVPETGFYNGTQNILLLDLGHFKVRKRVENTLLTNLCQKLCYFYIILQMYKWIFSENTLKTQPYSLFVLVMHISMVL